MIDWTILWIPIVGAVARNFAGWVENASEDGKWSKYELGLLGATTLKVVVLAVAAMFVGLDAYTATGTAVLADIGISTIKK